VGCPLYIFAVLSTGTNMKTIHITTDSDSKFTNCAVCGLKINTLDELVKDQDKEVAEENGQPHEYVYCGGERQAEMTQESKIALEICRLSDVEFSENDVQDIEMCVVSAIQNLQARFRIRNSDTPRYAPGV
jgi:hypothetical protein